MKCARMLGFFLLIGLLLGTKVAADAQPRSQVRWDGLPPEAIFEPITEATVEDISTLASLVSIARVTYMVQISTSLTMRTPTLLALEAGDLAFIAPEAHQGPIMLIRPSADEGGSTPLLVTPGSRLELAPGELLAIPPAGGDTSNPPSIGLVHSGDDPSVYLIAQVFPGGVPLARLIGGSSHTSVEFLDLPLGVQTALPPAPSAFEAGRLTIEPSQSSEVRLPTSPTLLVIEGGELGLVADIGQVEVKREGADFETTPKAIEPGGNSLLSPGDAAFASPGVAATVRNPGPGPVTVLVLTVKAPLLQAGTPTP